eukprot:g14719.t1
MGPLRNSFIGTMSKTVLLVLLALGGGRVVSAGKRAVPSSHQLRRQELSHTEDLRRQLRETKRALADAQQALAEKKQKLEQVEAQLLQSERRVVATLEAELSEHADGGLQGWAGHENTEDDTARTTSSHLVLQEAHNKLKERFQSLWKLQQEQQEAQGREREEWQKWEEEREQMLAKLLSCILVRDYIAGPGSFYCSATSATTAADPAPPLKLPLLALAGGRRVSASACSGVEELESAGTPSTAASGGRETPGTGSSSASTTSSTGGCAECSLDAECGPFEGENRAPGDDVSSTVRAHRGRWVAALQAVRDLVRGANNKPLLTASRESAWCSFSSEAARLMAGGARGAPEADGRAADDECLAMLEHGIQHLQLELEVPGI